MEKGTCRVTGGRRGLPASAGHHWPGPAPAPQRQHPPTPPRGAAREASRSPQDPSLCGVFCIPQGSHQGPGERWPLFQMWASVPACQHVPKCFCKSSVMCPIRSPLQSNVTSERRTEKMNVEKHLLSSHKGGPAVLAVKWARGVLFCSAGSGPQRRARPPLQSGTGTRLLGLVTIHSGEKGQGQSTVRGRRTAILGTCCSSTAVCSPHPPPATSKVRSVGQGPGL